MAYYITKLSWLLDDIRQYSGEVYYAQWENAYLDSKGRFVAGPHRDIRLKIEEYKQQMQILHSELKVCL